MSVSQLSLGIVGAGMIAGVICRAAARSSTCRIAGVHSRRQSSAEEFAREHGIDDVFGTLDAMLAAPAIDAVYVATPTAAKEDIALRAIRAGKHVLLDKPFSDSASIRRIRDAAHVQGVALMDATHFTHHTRTACIRERSRDLIGPVQAVRSAFFFPLADRGNIRFDISKEPSGALGDMAWYNLRALVEFAPDAGPIEAVSASVTRDPETGAIVRGSGSIGFASGVSSTFDFGYTIGACLMDLDLLGTRGVIRLDDFVLDWKDNFALTHPDLQVGFLHLSGIPQGDGRRQVTVEAGQPQAVRMLDQFARICREPGSADRRGAAERAVSTQDLVDAIWQAAEQR